MPILVDSRRNTLMTVSVEESCSIQVKISVEASLLSLLTISIGAWLKNLNHCRLCVFLLFLSSPYFSFFFHYTCSMSSISFFLHQIRIETIFIAWTLIFWSSSITYFALQGVCVFPRRGKMFHYTCYRSRGARPWPAKRVARYWCFGLGHGLAALWWMQHVRITLRHHRNGLGVRSLLWGGLIPKEPLDAFATL